MNVPVIPIAAVLEAYKIAVCERNVDDFMRLYDADARVFDTWGVWSFEGDASRRKTVEQWFGSLGTERVRVDFDDIQVTAGLELTLVTAIGSYAAIAADGTELRSMQNRLTWVLKRDADAWKIIHEHTSTPISFTDTKAIFRREPPQ